MTISVGELFKKSELHPAGVVQWDRQIPLDLPGVYIVTSTPELSDPVGRMGKYHPDLSALDALRVACPSVTVDGAPATNEKLAERIGAFWMPESAILYIGLASTSVQKRVGQYYNTRIGQRSPHAGGWWLKTLAGLGELYVHYAAANDPAARESLMLRTFAASVPDSLRGALYDTERIAPFANVKVSGGNKRHGLSNYKKLR